MSELNRFLLEMILKEIAYEKGIAVTFGWVDEWTYQITVTNNNDIAVTFLGRWIAPKTTIYIPVRSKAKDKE